jgi:hypothetical protein
MPLRGTSLPFTVSPRFGNAYSNSNSWASKDNPADSGSCGQNVAVLVLNSFNIPIVGSAPPRGNLCGLDINNMAAFDAIKISLAENIADGRVYELYINEYGQAYFQEIYPNAEAVNLDIRLCIPSTNINNRVDGVIVRGYDKPPVRSFKGFYEVIASNRGSLNPSTFGAKQSYHSLDAMVSDIQCYGSHFSKEARISYKDPVLETSYMDGIDNLYELNAFESLVGYVIDFDGQADPNIKYSFSDTSLVDIEITVNTGGVQTARMCGSAGETAITYYDMVTTIGPFNAQDKYGGVWPLLNSISQITCVGYKIEQIQDNTASNGQGPNGESVPQIICTVSPSKEVFSLSAGTNWYAELNGTSFIDLHIYYPVGESGSDLYYRALLLGNAYEGSRVYVKSGAGALNLLNIPTTSQVYGTAIPNIGGGLGVVVEKMIATIELDRPSVTVQHNGGEALRYAQALKVQYQPIIVVDEPAAVAYNFGGGSKLVDQTLDMFDSDPATVEVPANMRTGSLAWLQEQSVGNIIDVSLPFLSESDCLSFANSLYDVYSEETTTYTITCGPTSEPKLGARIAGYEGRINSISYSYQDSSAYNINVTIGPTLSNVGSWGNTLWQKRTSDVSREGIIVHASGDGVNYLVRVRGMGVYPAINMTLSAFAPGEKVSVTVYNNPVEA